MPEAAAATWRSDELPPPVRIGRGGWVRVATRGLALGIVTYGSLVVLLLVRLIERPLCGLARPVTPWITQGVCRAAFAILGIRFSIRGRPLTVPGGIVANHSGWLDIFALNAAARIYFVSKAEVARWPGIGWLARATGTVFIARDAREAGAQRDLFETRLKAGHRLVFFPEGTSTDSRRVLPFKSTLFAAFFAPDLRNVLHVQPVSVIYRAPHGADPRLYGWWGDMDFGAHFLAVLAQAPQGSVEVVFHEVLTVAACANRKALAASAEAVVRAGLTQGLR